MAIETSMHAELQRKAKDHLWLHFSSMRRYRGRGDPDHRARRGPVPLRHARQALPGLAQRPVHGADRLLVRRGARPGGAGADAAAAVLHELDVRAPARGRARRRWPSSRRPSINRAFFVSGGSEAVESAWKLARQYHAANGQPMRRKVIARKIAYHGTTMAPSRSPASRHPHAVRAADGRRPPRRQHQPLPLQVLRRGRRVHARVRRRGRRDDRVRKAPRPSPW